MKVCHTFLKAPGMKPRHQMVLSPRQDARWGGGGYQSFGRRIQQPQSTGRSKVRLPFLFRFLCIHLIYKFFFSYQIIFRFFSFLGRILIKTRQQLTILFIKSWKKGKALRQIIWIKKFNQLLTIKIQFYVKKRCKSVSLNKINWVYASNFRYRSVGWGCGIRLLYFCRGVRPTLNECPGYNAKMHLMVTLQFWVSGESGVLLHCYFSRVYSDPRRR